MENDEWRDRLAEAIAASGKSLRAISLDARVSAGYLHSILKDGKEPTIGRLLRICEAASASLPYVLYGLEMTATEEKLLRTYARLTPDQQEAFLRLANSTALVPSET